jgi:hypothetical protein
MTMAGTEVRGAGLSGTLNLTLVSDQLAHVLERSQADEPTGTWTGLACPDHGLELGADVDVAVLKHMSADGEVADLVWTAPADLAAEHARLCQAAIAADQAGKHETGERLWQQAQVLWYRAWSANFETLKLLQDAGVTRFSPVKPQRWVIASFEHRSGPHGIQNPHVHNIVLTALTTGAD